MRYLYSLLFYISLPLIFLRLWWKGIKVPDYRCRWLERLGFIKPLPQTGCIWIHAVSFGEMILAIPLIRRLKKDYPNQVILITTMTVTGSKLAQQQQDERVFHTYLPYDLPDTVQRFLLRIQPRMLILMETELWPNIIHYSSRNKIPILLANARLSNRSIHGYRFLFTLTRGMLTKIDLIAAQSQEDADRFLSLGASQDNLMVTGSMKFDIPVPMDLVAMGKAFRESWRISRPVIIAASTHATEEEKVLKAFIEVKKIIPGTLLILVPRHPERFDEVASLCKNGQFSVIRRSEKAPCTAETEIFLGDTLGEMFFYYAAADVAFVGGSFAPIGGHNLLEPAALGLPIISGPHVFNFKEIFRLLNEVGVANCVEDEMALAKLWTELLPKKLENPLLGEQGRQVVEKNRGAIEKHCHWISEQLAINVIDQPPSKESLLP